MLERLEMLNEKKKVSDEESQQYCCYIFELFFFRRFFSFETTLVSSLGNVDDCANSTKFIKHVFFPFVEAAFSLRFNEL